ncbi:MAG: type II toxin-antitoxin system RelE/ParE family toxin [Chloroflexi bacterium]|nr:type II toxin-antitoxin system RelE/ParE family toxin [Chloroflexota bacterium]MBI4198268.1 type II toxin-antitoxin system RelE/ParE family toxin [Chloroflexota bacterium]
MTWHVSFSIQAQKDLRSLDPQIAQRVIRAIDRLATSSHGDLKRLHGSNGELRLRAGDWRVRLVMDRQALILHILTIRHRSEAY